MSRPKSFQGQPAGSKPPLPVKRTTTVKFSDPKGDLADPKAQAQFLHRINKIQFTDERTGESLASPDTMSLKMFSRGTFELIQTLRTRLNRLPPHLLAEFDAKWKRDERSVKIEGSWDADGSNGFIMPQTAEEEEELVAQLKLQMADVDDALVREQYSHSAAHVVALEQKLLSYRACRSIEMQWPHKPGALQQATVDTLNSARSYCWAPNCVEAVAAKAELLVPEAMPADLPLGEVIQPAASGWWWFEKPIPLPTTSTGESVAALLWRRELRTGVDIKDALTGEPARVPHDMVVSLTWFSAFIQETFNFNGRDVLAPSPTLAWLWVDSVSLNEHEQNLQTRFRAMEVGQRVGNSAASVEDCAATALWFSKFWMAGGLWLDSRVTSKGRRRPSTLATVQTPLPRQQARQLARQYQLGTLPTVEVVYLRRTEPREPVEGGRARTREHEYCWLVPEFPRRQWFPSLGRHQLIMVTEHIRGPRDRPLKHATKVYAVNR